MKHIFYEQYKDQERFTIKSARDRFPGKRLQSVDVKHDASAIERLK